jgi:hypothetical protein
MKIDAVKSKIINSTIATTERRKLFEEIEISANNIPNDNKIANIADSFLIDNSHLSQLLNLIIAHTTCIRLIFII